MRDNESKQPDNELKVLKSTESDNEKFVQDIIGDADSQLGILKSAASKITGNSKEAVETRATLGGLAEEGRKAVRDFKKSVLGVVEKVVNIPQDYLKGRELKIPDNPKVMAELQKRIDDGGDLKAIIADFKKAAKNNEYSWYNLREKIDVEIGKKLEEAMAKNDIEGLLEWWTLLSADINKLIGAHNVTQAIASVMANGRRVYARPATSEKEWQERTEAVEKYEKDLEKTLAKYPALLDRWKEDRKSIYEKMHNVEILSKEDGFLADKPQELRKVFFKFGSEKQATVLKQWMEQDVYWDKILGDPEVEKISDVVARLPQLVFDFNDQTGFLFVRTARECAPERIKRVNEYPENLTKNIASVYAILKLQEIDDFDRDTVAGMTPAQLNTVTNYIVNTDEATVKQRLTPAAISSYYFINYSSMIPVVEFSPVIRGLTKGLRQESDNLDDDILNISVLRHILNKVPENLRDELFGRLKLTSLDKHSRYNTPTTEEIFNYISYAKEVGEQEYLNCRDFFEHSDYFSGDAWKNITDGRAFLKERNIAVEGSVSPETLVKIDWAKVRQGESFFDKNGISLPEGQVRQVLEMFQKVGDDKNDGGRELLKYFGQGTDMVEYKDEEWQGSARHGRYKSEYTVAKRSTETVNNIFELADKQKTYFEKDKDLWPGLLDCFGVLSKGPGMSAFVGMLGGKWEVGKEKYLDGPIVEGQLAMLNFILNYSGTEKLERINILTREQKLDYIRLKGIAIYFHPSLDNLGDVESGEVAKMVEFWDRFHISAGYQNLKLLAGRPDCVGLFYYLTNNEGKIIRENSAGHIAKMIEWKDAGLPDEFFVDAPVSDEPKKLVENMYSADADKVVKIAKEAVSRGIKMDLSEVVHFASHSPDITDDLINKFFSVIPYFDDPPLSYDVRDIDDLDLAVKFLSRMKILVPVADDYDRRTLLSALTPESYDQFFATDEALVASVNSYLKNRHQSSAEKKDDRPEEEIRADEISKILKKYDNKSGVEKKKIESLLGLMKTDDINPWGLDDIVEFACVMSEEQMSSLQTIHRLTENNFSDDVLERCIFPLLKDGKKAEEIISEMDGLTGGDGERTDGVYYWGPHRSEGLRNQLAKKMPSALIEPSIFYRDCHYESKDTFNFYRELSTLSDQGCRNAERLAKVVNSEYGSIITRNLVFILESPNFSVILEVINCRVEVEGSRSKSSSFWELMRADENYLSDFCQSVDEEVAKQYSALKAYPYLHIMAEDSAVFLNDPTFPAMLEFAKTMREIFGEKFMITGREMLLMDVENDLKNILTLKAGCYNKLDKELLSALSKQQDNELATSARKVLSVVDGGARNLALADVMAVLQKMSPELACRTILDNSHMFGWDILTDKTLERMFSADAEFKNKLILKLAREMRYYENINFETAKVIINDAQCRATAFRGSDNYDFVKAFSDYEKAGDFVELLANNNLLVKLDPRYLSREMRKSKSLWNSLLMFNPVQVLVDFDWVMGSVYTKDELHTVGQELYNFAIHSSDGSSKMVLNIYLSGKIDLVESELDSLVLKSIEDGLDMPIVYKLFERNEFKDEYSKKIYVRISTRLQDRTPEAEELFPDALKKMFTNQKEKKGDGVINWIDDRVINFISSKPERKNWLEKCVENISSVSQRPDKLCGIFLSLLDKFATIPEEKIAIYVSLAERINSSPSQEMQRIKDQLVEQLLETDDPETAYSKIENIFIKNNLPLVGKVFKIFEILHPISYLNEKLNQPSLSPYLKKAGPHRRYGTIFNDLLKIHIESGNRSLRQYIEILKDGEQNFAFLASGKSVDSLSIEELKKMKHYFAKVNTLFLNSQLDKVSDSVTLGDELSSVDVLNIYSQLKNSLNVAEGQSVNDRLAQMFFKPLGYKNFDEILGAMKNKKKEANGRSLQLVEQAQDGHLSINKGDLLKGVDKNYIHLILQNGSVAKEYLGSGASSDMTPFDTDVAMVLGDTSGKKFSSILGSSMANVYGDIMFVIKDRGQFEKTTDNIKLADVDKKKMELFQTGGPEHYGIRTGLASTEIDFIVAKVVAEKELRNLYVEIVQNGYYIPVTDQEGKIIFTPQMYEEYRKFYVGLDRFDGEGIQFSETKETDPHFNDVTAIKEGLDKTWRDVETATDNIRTAIHDVLKDYGIVLKDSHDMGIIGAELIDSGSTGRHTNMAGNFDFDLVLKLDDKDVEKVPSIVSAIEAKMKPGKNNSHAGQDDTDIYQLRFEGATNIFSNPLDIDIAFTRKSELSVYGSHDAVKEKLDWIKNNVGEDEYKTVIANIILTKEILKKGSAYKKFEHGGMGGIGVENWILASGGNMKEAFRSFYEAANDNGHRLSLFVFREKYKIVDPGVNVKFLNHDNFIYLLKEEGYQAMLNVVENYLGVKHDDVSASE